MRSSPHLPQLVSWRAKFSRISFAAQRAPLGRSGDLLHYAREGDTMAVTALIDWVDVSPK